MTSAVYDTNILISGLFWRGVPRRVIHLARNGAVQAITCQALLDELKDVLIRPNKPFQLSEQEVDRVLDGDPDLLDLKTHRQIRVITAREFFDTIETSRFRLQ